MQTSLYHLPQEVLHQIVLSLSAFEVATFERICRKFKSLCGPVVWRHLCIRYFKYWNRSHAFPQRVSKPADETDWKSLFSKRFRTNQEIDHTLNDILNFQSNRTDKVKSIVEHQLDAKDVLLQNTSSDLGKHDILARRYHSNAILGCLHRYISVQQWSEMGMTPQNGSRLEGALVAFDGFADQEDYVDIAEVSQILDDIADNFQKNFSEFHDLTLREKAVSLARYVRMQNLVGLSNGEDVHYHDLQNNFIGHALREERHTSLPLISVAIYCSIARRLGLDTGPCCFPFHVIAVVRSEEQESFYFDPFQSAEEIPISSLITQLESMGASQHDFEKLLGIAPTTHVVGRCARNIITSIQTLPRVLGGDLRPSTESAFYAALWALLIIPSVTDEDGLSLGQTAYLPVIIDHLQTHFPTDIWLLQKYISALFKTGEHDTRQRLQSIRDNIDAQRPVKRRTSKNRDKVKYQVGQVFRHKRYQYHAIITGWDDRCIATDQWINQMRVHDLPLGPNQSFYHVLVEDKTTRYVAEENINIVQQGPIPALMEIAGQYFKRWDEDTEAFVSNILDEYPDD